MGKQREHFRFGTGDGIDPRWKEEPEDEWVEEDVNPLQIDLWDDDFEDEEDIHG